MKIQDRVVVVTGGAAGIGRALCRRFAAAGARGVVVSDLDPKGAGQLAQEIGGLAVATDVAVEANVVQLVEAATKRYGRIDLFCSNAGMGGLPGGTDVPNEVWQRIWDVNVMGHVYAARAVLPAMIARREGYLLHTASAAGLLTQVASAPYSVTKHATVAFAEWLAITYHNDGIKVSCLCPQGVRTQMLLGESSSSNFLVPGALEPEQVAETVLAGIEEERFLILPHPDVAEYFRRKADDYDRWLRGMVRFREKVLGAPQ
ncbi:MAG: short-chain dehydrogenase [Acidobacteria bacterium]|nr:MAG: short-chain dehydrogenase [Acidobacteriota bacterium]